MTQSQRDAAEHIAALSREMEKTARRNGLPFLAYLLGMAAEESGTYAVKPPKGDARP